MHFRDTVMCFTSQIINKIEVSAKIQKNLGSTHTQISSSYMKCGTILIFRASCVHINSLESKKDNQNLKFQKCNHFRDTILCFTSQIINKIEVSAKIQQNLGSTHAQIGSGYMKCGTILIFRASCVYINALELN